MSELLNFDPTESPHRRWNPLSQSWVLVSPHRTKRPWQGQVEPPAKGGLPEFDEKCYLCPGNERSNGERNPEYDSTFYFVNDFSAVFPQNVKPPPSPHPLIKSEPVSGRCYVVCFHPSHNLTIAQMSMSQVLRIVEAWQDLYVRIPHEEKEVRYVQIFENKGAIMGCSNPHTHGQIWAVSYIPDEPAKALESQAAYAADPSNASRPGVKLGRTGRPSMLLDYAAFELEAKERLICANEDFIAVVPYWAVWPFETLVLPRKEHLPSLAVLTEKHRASLAEVIREVTCRYDNIFKCSFPYSMGLHQRPIAEGGDPAWDDAQLHIHFYPPLLRSASVRKFLVGFEMLAHPQRDLTPEQAADRIRETTKTHYSLLENPEAA